MQESGYLHRHRDDFLLWWMGFGIGGVGGKPEVPSDGRRQRRSGDNHYFIRGKGTRRCERVTYRNAVEGLLSEYIVSMLFLSNSVSCPKK